MRDSYLEPWLGRTLKPVSSTDRLRLLSNQDFQSDDEAGFWQTVLDTVRVRTRGGTRDHESEVERLCLATLTHMRNE